MAKKTEGIEAYGRLLRAVEPYKWKLVLACVCMAVVAVTNGGTTYLVKPVIDEIFAEKNKDTIVLLSLAYPLLFLLKGVFGFAQSYIMAHVGQSVIRDLRVQLYEHILALDQSFFFGSSTGELLSRVTNDVKLVQASVTKVLTGLVQHFLSIIVLSIVIIKLDWKLAALALTVFPIAVWPLYVFGRKVRTYSKRGQKNVGNLASKIVDSVKGVRVVQVFQMEQKQTDAFTKEANELYSNLFKQARTRAMSSPIMELIGGIGIGIVVYLGGSRVISGEITQGTFLALITSLMLLYDPIKKLDGLNASVNKGIASAERIYELIDRKSLIEDTGTRKAENLQESIRFENISFAYNSENGKTLDDINFEIRVGETVALVGPSGAGKSTIVDFLPRFLEPDTGQVTWDSVDTREYSLASIRDKIAMVDQQTVLFNGTLRDNLQCTHTELGDDVLWEALKDANLDRHIRELPKQLDTRIGEDGVQLSGGQRQRLAIARAILKNASLLVLDEATSSLDTASEQAVQQALFTLMQGRTSVVIAHRLSTVKDADEIIVLKQGRIVQRGNFDALVNQPGLFAELVEQQSLES